MLKSMALATTLVAATLAGAERASAIALTLDGPWESFSFSGDGSVWSDNFTFTVAPGESAFFQVTDAFLSGDRFEFFENGVSLGLTSAPATLGDQIGADPDGAFADPRWSSGQAQFFEGSYTITGIAVNSPFGSGGAFARLVSTDPGGPPIGGVVPLPAAGWRLLGGIGCLAFVRKRIG
jgi:hypothetical protein